MFNRLRNRFLMLNIVIISVAMHVAFVTVYLIAYHNMRADIDAKLRTISEHYRGPAPPPAATPPNHVPVPPEQFASFSLTTDPHGNISTISSIFNIGREFYESAGTKAAAQHKNQGTFELNGNDWAFLIQPDSAGEGNTIVFLNITSRQAMNMNFMHSVSAVALAMAVIILLISMFFANQSILPVKAAFDKQQRFIADASHELRAPLAAINTNVDALLSKGEDPIRTQSKWLRYIKLEVERMSKLTNDLLYLTQVDHSDPDMMHAEFPVSEAVENVILTMEAAFFENRISLHYHVEPGLVMRGNREQIQQVVMILLDNALHYTNENGAVEVAVQRRHLDLVVTVSNTGEGISAEHLETVFDRFYRTDTSRARKSGGYGYGLGLAIAKQIVEQHKGRLYCKSTIHEKTTFYMELPSVLLSSQHPRSR